MTAGRISGTSYRAQRLTIATDATFEDLRWRYETAVPSYDGPAFDGLVEQGASWAEVLELMNRSAPYGFVNYASFDMQPMMGLAGAPACCVEYLMGNHTIAERMFRHDPTAMMYAPLRTVIAAEKPGGAARFSIEQPSGALSSFGNEAIAAVGDELDGKVARLLEHLRIPVPPSLV